MDFIKGKAHGRVHLVPVVLVFVTDNGKHLRYVVASAFDAALSARVGSTFYELMHTEWFEYGGCELSAKLRSVVGHEGGRVST